MCGIVGTFDPAGRLDRDVLQQMNAQLVHRGPDDEGYFLSGAIGLGMRRLSIIDLPGGHQPMANENGRCRIVFNGEIYNYRELGTALRQSGHIFATRSDTETILHQYEESGPDCVHLLNGMFAFAIWDEDRQRLFVARDRLGVKPLYYHWDGTTLHFASEIKAILASAGVPADLCEEALWHYLSFRYVPAPLTIWRNIRKLPPGHHLMLNARTGTLVVERYWDIRYAPAPEPTEEVSDIEEFSSRFLDAVRRRLVADVPVGVLLSGGLDSSAVCAAVAEVHNAPLSTFSIGFRERGEFNELPYARQVARHFGTDHHEVEIDADDFLRFLPSLVRYTDEPLADLASVPLYYLARLASERVKVVLSGEGSDEVLAGYEFGDEARRWARLRRLQRLPRWMRSTVPDVLLRTARSTRGTQRLTSANIPLGERNARLAPYMTNYLSSSEKRTLWPTARAFGDSEEIIRRYYRDAGTADPLHQMLYAYCQDWLVEDLLMKADKMTMANSIELRVPFLDYSLVEWLASRPPERKVRRQRDGRWVTKYLLRRFAESRLPRAIIDRPKRGFPVPMMQWVQGGPLAGWARETLLASDAHVGGMFDRPALAELVERGTSVRQPLHAGRLWLLLVLETWLREWR